MDNQSFHRFKIGQFDCIAIKDKSQAIHLEKQFPQVDKLILELALKECGITQLMPDVGFNVLLVDTGQQKIMIDCGYANEGLGENLKTAGISYDDIDVVFITHGDGDHIGGIDNYPNAKFYIPRKAFELWTSETGRQQLVDEFEKVFIKFIPPDILSKKLQGRIQYGSETLPRLKDRIKLIEPDHNIFPGIKVIEAFGHRSDHYAVEISSNGETLLHIVDAFRHPVQVIKPEWYSFVDSYPDRTVETIKTLLARARTLNATIFGAHLTFPGILKLY